MTRARWRSGIPDSPCPKISFFVFHARNTRRRRFPVSGIVPALRRPARGLLIAARALQGLGAAFTAPAVLSLVAASSPEGETRNRAMAILGAVSSCGFIAGLVLGGVLTGQFGWRWVFFVNVSVGAAVIIMTLAFVRESRRFRQSVDIPGAFTATAGLTLLLYACSAVETAGLFSAGTWGILLALLLLAAFVFIESRIRHPLIPLSVFRNRRLAGALGTAGAFGAMMGPMLFLMTLYLQNVLGLGPLETGAAFLPQEIAVIAVSLFVGRIVSRIGTKAVLALGMAGFGAGMLTLAGLSAEGSYWHVLFGLIFIGIGVACVIVAGAVAATDGVDPAQQGLAAGLWNATPHIGTAVGLAALTTVADAFSGHALRDASGMTIAAAESWVSGFRAAFLFALVFAAFGLWCALFPTKPSPGRSKTPMA